MWYPARAEGLGKYDKAKNAGFILNSFLNMPVVSKFRICQLYLLQNTPQRKGCPVYDTKPHLMVKLEFCRSGECTVPLHCHYSRTFYPLSTHSVNAGLVKQSSVMSPSIRTGRLGNDWHSSHCIFWSCDQHFLAAHESRLVCNLHLPKPLGCQVLVSSPLRTLIRNVSIF